MTYKSGRATVRISLIIISVSIITDHITPRRIGRKKSASIVFL